MLCDLGGSAKLTFGRHSSGRRYWHRGTKLGSGHRHSSGRHCDTTRWYADDAWFDVPEWDNSKYNYTRNDITQRHSGNHDAGINDAEYSTWFHYSGNARRDYAGLHVTKRHAKYHNPRYDCTERCAGNDYDAGGNFAQWNPKYVDTGNHHAANATSEQHSAFNHASRIEFVK